MQKFTIRDIENMCDIKAHTLRIWEQRYQLFTPQRTESAQRFYDSNDLKKMLSIAYLYHNGWRISKIAALGEAGIETAISQLNGNTEKYGALIVQLLQVAVDFDEGKFRSILEGTSDKIGVEDCIIQVAFPFLQRIGLLWMTNHIIPAQEHFSTYLIQHHIIAATERLDPGAEQKGEIVLFTPEGEHHELPLVFIAYLLKKYGWRTLYFGSNVKWQDLETVISRTSVTSVYIHLVTRFTRYDIDDYFEEVCKAFAGKKVISSGTAVHAAQRSFVNLELLKSDAAIYAFVSGEPTSEARRS